MLKKKHYLYLNESEHSILVKSLVQLKNEYSDSTEPGVRHVRATIPVV